MAQTDEALLTAWRDGDREAGGELFDRHYASIKRFFASKVGPEYEELVQRTFLRCTQSRDAFRGESSVRGYLFAIAWNVLREHLRRRIGHDARFEPAQDSAVDLGLPGPSTVAGAKREQAVLLEALRRLPLEHQVVLELFYWEGWSAAQIGQALGRPEGTVRSRLRLAKEALRGHVDEVARNPAELSSTLDGLDRWARELAAQLSA